MVTDSMESILYSSLDNYYKRLSLEGYCEYEKVYKLLLLIFLDRILSGYYGFYVTEDEINELTRYLYKATGNCLIRFPMENTKDSISIIPSVFASLRESGSGALRVSEEDYLRKVM